MEAHHHHTAMPFNRADRRATLGHDLSHRLSNAEMEELQLFGDELCILGKEGVCHHQTIDLPPPPMHTRTNVAHVIHSAQFHLFILGLILLDCACVACELCILVADPFHQHVPKGVSVAFDKFGSLLLYCFMVESLVHVWAEGKEFFNSTLNVFDFSVIWLSYIIDYATQGHKEWIQLIMLARLWRVVRVIDSVALSTSIKAKRKFAEERTELEDIISIWKERYLHEREKKLIAIKFALRSHGDTDLEALMSPIDQ